MMFNLFLQLSDEENIWKLQQILATFMKVQKSIYCMFQSIDLSNPHQAMVKQI